MATESYLQSYIRYACVYSGILCTGHLVKACKMFSCGCTTFLLLWSLLIFSSLKKMISYLIRYQTQRKPGRNPGKWPDLECLCTYRRNLARFNFQSQTFSYRSRQESVPALKAEIKASRECDSEPRPVRNAYTEMSDLQVVWPYKDIWTGSDLLWVGSGLMIFLTCLKSNQVNEFQHKKKKRKEKKVCQRLLKKQ